MFGGKVIGDTNSVLTLRDANYPTVQNIPQGRRYGQRTSASGNGSNLVLRPTWAQTGRNRRYEARSAPHQTRL